MRATLLVCAVALAAAASTAHALLDPTPPPIESDIERLKEMLTTNQIKARAAAKLNATKTRLMNVKPQNATQLLAAVNATGNSIVDEFMLLKQMATIQTSRRPFTGGVTCFEDPATGDVVGLQFEDLLLCSDAGRPKTFVVPSDSYIASMKLAVDPMTELVGKLSFTIKSNSSIFPQYKLSCGTGSVLPGVDLMPKLSAFASMNVSCRAAGGVLGRRRLMQPAAPLYGLDPVSFRVNVTTIRKLNPRGIALDDILAGSWGDESWGDTDLEVESPPPVLPPRHPAPWRLATSVVGGGIFTSDTTGAQWTRSGASNRFYFTLAASADAQTLYAGTYYNGRLWKSADFGATWNQLSAPAANWISITVSFDGTKIAACVDGGGIWISNDGGGSFVQASGGLPSQDGWYRIASSSDNSKIFAVVNNGGIWRSLDGGVTWGRSTVGLPSGLRIWHWIVSSADGNTLLAVEYQGGVFRSTDAGGSWTRLTNGLPATADWMTCATSLDGNYLTVAAYGAGIYYSRDGGASWSLSNVPPSTWVGMIATGDGALVAAVATGDGVYLSTNDGESFQYEMTGLTPGLGYSAITGSI